LNNADLRLQNQQDSNEADQPAEFDKLDFHHFEKDETLGSFLVRIAQ
jgi:hypothetical protein